MWLDAPLPVLWARVRHKDSRPLLRAPDPYATLAALLEARAPIYALADLRVPSQAGVPLDTMARRVQQALIAQRSDVLEEVP